VTFLLDANVLFDFQNSAPDGLLSLVRAAASLEMAIAEQVYDEATLNEARDSDKVRSKKRAALGVLRNSAITRIEVLPGTPQQRLMSEFLTPLKLVKKKDAGEAASVAIAKSDRRYVFVTSDTTATLWALNELFGTGERVVRVHAFVRLLRERGVIDAAVVRALDGPLRQRSTLPLWWSSWLAQQ
jgi:hypothetical protein